MKIYGANLNTQMSYCDGQRERERKMTIKIVKTMRYGYQKLRRKRKTTFNRLNEENNTSKYSSENSGLKFTQNASKVKIFIGLKL